MSRWLVLISLIYSFYPFNGVAKGESETIVFGGFKELVIFGEGVTFQVKVDVPQGSEIEQVYLYIEIEASLPIVEKVQVNSGGEINFQLDVEVTPLRPFTEITYHYKCILLDGSTHESEDRTFLYEDTSVDWQRLDDGLFYINWYERDLIFGQTVLNTARSGLQTAQRYLPVNMSNPIRVYVYNSTTSLQTAIELSSSAWIAGHASPDVGIILVSIPPGPEERLELERQLPHEITHILEYLAVGSAYQQTPKWLLEGLASLAEMHPNPDYPHMLSTAVNNQSLLTMEALCHAFPSDIPGTLQAYAQSESFVRYLYQTYGASNLYRLLMVYKDGQGCLEGMVTVYGSSLGQLEYRWQQEKLGIDTPWLALENLGPYLILLVVLLLLPIIYALVKQVRSV